MDTDTPMPEDKPPCLSSGLPRAEGGPRSPGCSRPVTPRRSRGSGYHWVIFPRSHLQAHPYEHGVLSRSLPALAVRGRAHGLPLDLPGRRPPLGQQRDERRQFLWKATSKLVNSLDFGAGLPAFKSLLPDFMGGVTSVGLSSSSCGGGHWKGQEMGLQALHQHRG